jgi:predicted Zn finger-like uncharacterized protein
MNASCPQCSTVYRVDPAKVPDGGVRARCSSCGGVIPVGMDSSQTSRQTPADAMSAAFSERRPQPGPFVPGQQRTPPRGAQRPTPPVTPRVTPPASPRTTPPAAPAIRTPSSPASSLGASLPPLRPTPRAASPAMPTPPAQARVSTRTAPAQQAVSVPAETPPSAPMPTPAAAAPPGSTAEAATQGSRRPINPFLARGPSLRAKRLARALVSDMVAYYPAKHAEGLEKGTLKELFRDEIKKSYEEYVAQVGADFARSTTHFQESLNEVLGAGRKIF